MANLRVQGLDELEKELQQFAGKTEEIEAAMLEAGAEELKQAWKYHILKKGHVDTGSMVDAVKASKPRKGRGGTSVDVYPQGKDQKGVRNAEKAFLLHYGWKDKPGDHFVDNVEQDAEEAVADAMEGVLDEYLTNL